MINYEQCKALICWKRRTVEPLRYAMRKDTTGTELRGCKRKDTVEQ